MRKIIAFDFDGTVCENAWPQIGAPKQDVIDALKAEQAGGAFLILWTCRTGTQLSEAEVWLRSYDLYPDAVNKNAPETFTEFGSDPRKVYADEYWDDKNKDITTIDELSNYAHAIGAAHRGRPIQ